MPSKKVGPEIASRLYEFRNVNVADGEVIAMLGVTISEVAVLLAFGAKAAFGVVSASAVEATQFEPEPECVVVQPDGNALPGSASKFSVNPLIGWPAVRMKLCSTGPTGPKLLLIDTTIFNRVPLGVFAGTT